MRARAPPGREYVCPECGTANISSKSPKHGTRQRQNPEDYRCNSRPCRAHFDRPELVAVEDTDE